MGLAPSFKDKQEAVMNNLLLMTASFDVMINTLLFYSNRLTVGADLSRTPPIYRPSMAFTISLSIS
jgi:hypothetical protein